MPDDRRQIGLMLTGTARDAVAAALVRAGFEVHIASSLQRVRALVARTALDAWVFDARVEEVLPLLLPTGSYLLPADDIPDAAGSAPGWAQSLVTQLTVALAVGRQPATARARDNWSAVRGVWLLAGSAGATGAVQEFLDAFSQPPPVAFLYAQHLEPARQHLLRDFNPRSPHFSLCTEYGLQMLEPARLVMVSPRHKVAIGGFGEVTTTGRDWDGHHTPDISELLVILSAARLPSPGVIIFSGMGDDGASALPVFEAAGGRVWVQSPASAVCPGMPQAALASGLVHRSDAPAALARALTDLYPA